MDEKQVGGEKGGSREEKESEEERGGAWDEKYARDFFDKPKQKKGDEMCVFESR